MKQKKWLLWVISETEQIDDLKFAADLLSTSSVYF